MTILAGVVGLAGGLFIRRPVAWTLFFTLAGATFTAGGLVVAAVSIFTLTRVRQLASDTARRAVNAELEKMRRELDATEVAYDALAVARDRVNPLELRLAALDEAKRLLGDREPIGYLRDRCAVFAEQVNRTLRDTHRVDGDLVLKLFETSCSFAKAREGDPMALRMLLTSQALLSTMQTIETLGNSVALVGTEGVQAWIAEAPPPLGMALLHLAGQRPDSVEALKGLGIGIVRGDAGWSQVLADMKSAADKGWNTSFAFFARTADGDLVEDQFDSSSRQPGSTPISNEEFVAPDGRLHFIMWGREGANTGNAPRLTELAAKLAAAYPIAVDRRRSV